MSIFLRSLKVTETEGVYHAGDVFNQAQQHFIGGVGSHPMIVCFRFAVINQLLSRSPDHFELFFYRRIIFEEFHDVFAGVIITSAAVFKPATCKHKLGCCSLAQLAHLRSESDKQPSHQTCSGFTSELKICSIPERFF